MGQDGESMFCTSRASSAVKQLDAVYAKLCIAEEEGSVLDAECELAQKVCQELLRTIETAAECYCLQPASREYRSTFSINYRMLFPDESRDYRVSVLASSVRQCTVVWANGAKFEFSPHVVQLAGELQNSWGDLRLLLDMRRTMQDDFGIADESELHTLLTSFDAAWAHFEERYVLELMEIEEKAKGLVVDAVDCERALYEKELELGSPDAEFSPELAPERRQLMLRIGKLNAVANFARKGRDDLHAGVLEAALAMLARSHTTPTSTGMDAVVGSDSPGAFAPDGVQRPKSQVLVEAMSEEQRVEMSLATDIYEAFRAMRDYLMQAGKCLARVDPQLRNNKGLVARLVDIEESFEIGARYVLTSAVLEEVCGLVATVRALAQTTPAFATICEESGVELFLALPRIVWLRYLGEPSRNALLGVLLPHRFPDEADAEDLQALMGKYTAAREALFGALSGAFPSPSSPAAKEEMMLMILLMHRATLGAESTQEAFSRFLQPLESRLAAFAAVESFMNGLEVFSMELQRHCAEDWNQCASIIVQRLGVGSAPHTKDRRKHFEV
eukprot:TRINITY_DN2169_c0_g1_i1.p1 TRINITY_DN2169_c0_g1~~TRINITY_DN2169_c0_g1_i1.p1  ORF type:complete len:603 (+),score=101.13 TRINITY_DN2169_c0_g1_i1:134-1810(+)